jgi:hypothetical protein
MTDRLAGLGAGDSNSRAPERSSRCGVAGPAQQADRFPPSPTEPLNGRSGCPRRTFCVRGSSGHALDHIHASTGNPLAHGADLGVLGASIPIERRLHRLELE